MLRDDLDQQIVALLAGNARLSYPAIGDRVGLSAPAVKRRIDRLVHDGTITAFTIRLDPTAVGTTIEAFIEVHCRGKTSPDELRRLASSQQAVTAAYTVTGEADALLHVECRDNHHLEETLEQIRSHRAVERTASVIVLSRLVSRTSPTPTG